MQLRVFDVAGRLVRVLADEELPASRYAFEWDGRDGDGRVVSRGVYFCRFDSEDRLYTRKMLVVD